MDKVSIITTFYNAQNFILDAINSINQQQITDDFTIEYVLVNDKSTDKSLETAQEFVRNFGNKSIDFKFIEPAENLGCGGARKFGIDHATGNYFMFLDADDYYMHKDFVNRAYHDIKREAADIVEYGVLFNQPNGQQINNTISQKAVIENNPALAEIALFKDNMIKFNVWSKIYTREIVESYPYSTVRTYEDVRTIPVWVSNAKKIVIMPVTEINYRAAAGSIIRTNMVETRLGTISGIADLFPRFKDDKNILKAMYTRAMVDLEALLHNHSSNDEGFNEMSKLNTYMLSFIYPDKYKEITYHIEEEGKPKDEEKEKTQVTPDKGLEDIDIE
jgi:glycosyltransferase involved in cell wall biosynthesis